MIIRPFSKSSILCFKSGYTLKSFYVFNGCLSCALCVTDNTSMLLYNHQTNQSTIPLTKRLTLIHDISLIDTVVIIQTLCFFSFAVIGYISLIGCTDNISDF